MMPTIEETLKEAYRSPFRGLSVSDFLFVADITASGKMSHFLATVKPAMHLVKLVFSHVCGSVQCLDFLPQKP